MQQPGRIGTIATESGQITGHRIRVYAVGQRPLQGSVSQSTVVGAEQNQLDNDRGRNSDGGRHGRSFGGLAPHTRRRDRKRSGEVDQQQQRALATPPKSTWPRCVSMIRTGTRLLYPTAAGGARGHAAAGWAGQLGVPAASCQKAHLWSAANPGVTAIASGTKDSATSDR